MNIENKKQFATILMAVGLGLVAAFLTSQYVQRNIQQQTDTLAKEYNKRTASVVQDMERLKSELDQVNVRQAELAKQQQNLPKIIQSQGGSASSVEKKGPVQMESFQIKVPPGKRALTLLFDPLSAVGGLIHAGDFVDVIGHLEVPTGEEIDGPKGKKEKVTETVTSVLFQEIQVLAVDTTMDPISKKAHYKDQQSKKAINVTLAVTPEEAGLMSFSQEQGRLQLVLRSPAENENWQLKVAAWDSLSEFLYERQGTDLFVSEPELRIIEAVGVVSQTDEVRSHIQIFRGGQQGGDEE